MIESDKNFIIARDDFSGRLSRLEPDLQHEGINYYEPPNITTAIAGALNTRRYPVLDLLRVIRINRMVPLYYTRGDTNRYTRYFWNQPLGELSCAVCYAVQHTKQPGTTGVWDLNKEDLTVAARFVSNLPGLDSLNALLMDPKPDKKAVYSRFVRLTVSGGKQPLSDNAEEELLLPVTPTIDLGALTGLKSGLPNSVDSVTAERSVSSFDLEHICGVFSKILKIQGRTPLEINTLMEELTVIGFKQILEWFIKNMQRNQLTTIDQVLDAVNKRSATGSSRS